MSKPIPWSDVTASGELIDRVRITFSGAHTLHSVEECIGVLDTSTQPLLDKLRAGKVDRETERSIEALMSSLTQIYYTLPQL